MKFYKTQGFILKLKNIGERDKLIWLLTERKGKISIIAKGVRNTKSKRGIHIDIMNLNKFSLHKGKSLDSVRDTTSIDTFATLKKINPYVFFYIAELLNKIEVEPDEGRKLFSLIQDILENSNKQNLLKNLAFFELNFLKIIGFEPNLKYYVNSQKVLNPDSLFPSTNIPGYQEYSNQQNPIPAVVVKTQRIFLTGNIQHTLALALSDDTIKTLRHIHTAWIQNLIEKKINSLEFL